MSNFVVDVNEEAHQREIIHEYANFLDDSVSFVLVPKIMVF